MYKEELKEKTYKEVEKSEKTEKKVKVKILYKNEIKRRKQAS